jgi:multidrug efflux pump subunit AcrB
MTPIEAAIKGSNEIFCSNFYFYHAGSIPTGYIWFVGRLFREFGVVIGAAVLISAFVSLTLTPMLNAYLMKAANKKSKFYNLTEPYFKSLTAIMLKRWGDYG